MATTAGPRCIHVFEGRILEEHSWQSRAYSDRRPSTPTPVFHPASLTLSLSFPPSPSSVTLSLFLSLRAAYPPIYHSTFHISKTLNHLSVLSRACLAVIDRTTLRVHVWHRLGAARRGQPSGTRRDATTGFVRASCTFVLVRGIATRDFEELPCGKVGPCLELPLGGVSRAIRAVSARTVTSAPPG